MEPLQTSLLGVGPPGLDPHAVDPSWADAAFGLARTWLRGGDTLLVELVESVAWQQGRRWMFDRMVDDPRLTSFGKRAKLPKHRALTEARAALESRYGVRLSGPGLNYYRDGRDSVAPHSDRELRRLDDTLVAILTLGARRPFLVRPKAGGPSHDLAPASGDLLVMGGRMQLDWEHAVPKVARSGPRVSVSWRWATPADPIDAPPGTLGS